MKSLTINLMFSGSSIIIMVDLLSSIIHLSTIKNERRKIIPQSVDNKK